MGRGTRLVGCRQSEIVDKFRMNPLGRERTKEGECGVTGAGCIWFPTRFLNFFPIDVKHVRRSDRPLPREDPLPYSMGRVLPNDNALKVVWMKGESKPFREER
jgi:hypothetical protein